MLYGDVKVQEAFIKKVKELEKEQGFKAIFAAMVGSVSHDTTRIGSDYDTRVLYIREDFGSHIMIPEMCEEKEIIYRYYPKEKDLFYEWIPCWEATSFFQYLANPSIDHKFSYGLYNVVLWTLSSPYQWDPYGLAQKILPMIHSILNIKYACNHFLELIEQCQGMLDDGVVMSNNQTIPVKYYNNIIRAILSIKWLLKYKTIAPVNLSVLMRIVGDDTHVTQFMRRIHEEQRLEGETYRDKLAEVNKYTLLDNRIVPDQKVNAYIMEQITLLTKEVDAIESEVDKEEVECVIQHIYEIIAEALTTPAIKNITVF